MSRPTLFLDDAAHGRISIFKKPLAVICADQPEAVPEALKKIRTSQENGYYAAGFFSYEAGYALEPKLAGRMPQNRDLPLIWFGVFEKPEDISITENTDIFAPWIRGRAHAGPLHYDWSAEQYRARFERVQELILAGDIYEANLTFGADFSFFGDPLALYRKLRKSSACGYGAFLDTGEKQFLSLSPELFFEIHDGCVTCRPMKGTAARYDDPTADKDAATALQTSIKDRAENLMIVDLLRNDVSRLSRPGTVSVPEIFRVETYPTVHQMTSVVKARLNPGTDVSALIRALFPCGSITGAPKIRAMEVLQEIENQPRGIYCGAIGVFRPDGDACFNVAIRTLTLSGNRGRLGIGGAVVYDSTAESEYAEAKLKARYMDQHCRELQLIETLRYDPKAGFVRQPRHLARMAQAAAHFVIPFSQAAAGAALKDIIPDADKTWRVRLTLSEGGEFAASAAPLSTNPPRWRYILAKDQISSRDAFARYKTDKRRLYTESWQAAHDHSGADEVLFCNERGELAEGSRSSLFIRKKGRLLTPPLSSGALNGVLRAELLATGKAEEAVLMPEDLKNPVFLGNSLRGLIAAVAIQDHNGDAG